LVLRNHHIQGLANSRALCSSKKHQIQIVWKESTTRSKGFRKTEEGWRRRLQGEKVVWSNWLLYTSVHPALRFNPHRREETKGESLGCKVCVCVCGGMDSWIVWPRSFSEWKQEQWFMKTYSSHKASLMRFQPKPTLKGVCGESSLLTLNYPLSQLVY